MDALEVKCRCRPPSGGPPRNRCLQVSCTRALAVQPDGEERCLPAARGAGLAHDGPLELVSVDQVGRGEDAHLMQDSFIAEVERLSGRRVTVFISNSHVGPDLKIELFVLED